MTTGWDPPESYGRLAARVEPKMQLPAAYYREILSHALEGKPNEICGLIAGKDGVLVKLWRTTNNDPNPRVRYNVEPLELLGVLREIDAKGWALAAIYHSHPATDAYPSSTDIGLAYYPETVYIIVSLAREGEPAVRAFRIVDGSVVEEPLEIVEGPTVSAPCIAAGGQFSESETHAPQTKPHQPTGVAGLLATVQRWLKRHPVTSDRETRQGDNAR